MHWSKEMSTDNQKEIILIKQAFRNLNTYKRYRAMHEANKMKSSAEGDRLELMRFKTFDQLELTLRGLQTELRRMESTSEEEQENESEG